MNKYEAIEFESTIHRAASIELERITHDDQKWVKLVVCDLAGNRNTFNIFGTNGEAKQFGLRAAETVCEELRAEISKLRDAASEHVSHSCPECGFPVYHESVAYCSRACVDEANAKRERVLIDEMRDEAEARGMTFGYIGNCGNGFDDRGWSFYAPHPGRVGTAADRFGMARTSELHTLYDALKDGDLDRWLDARGGVA